MPAINAGLRAILDAYGNPTGIAGPGGNPLPGSYQGSPGNVLTKNSKLAFDLTLGDLAGTYVNVPVNAGNNATGVTTIGYTGATSTLSTEWSQFSNVSRKVVATINTNAQVRFSKLNITVDPVDRALELAVYIPVIPSELLGSAKNPGITVRFSDQDGGAGGKSETWLFDGSCLRQGVNTLRMCADDTLAGTTGQGKGNLGAGIAHAGSNPLDWTQPIKYMEINLSGWLSTAFGAGDLPQSPPLYFDQLRKAARATPILVIGFDAAGQNSGDTIFIDKVAPLFAKYGLKGYVTATGAAGNSANSGDLTYAGGPDWQRRVTLQNQFGWDVINHTWNHGGMGYGRIITSVTLNRANNIVTATVPAHGMFIGTTLKVNVTGATPVDMNGVYTATAASATTLTYACVGADGAAARLDSTIAITIRTTMSEIFNTDTPENRALVLHEMKAMSDCMRGTGLFRAAHIAAFPNNSVPELATLSYACQAAGVKYARGSRGGYTIVNEFGVDNPLNFGSFELGSSVNNTAPNDEKYTLAYIKAKIEAMPMLGVHCWLYGHFIRDESVETLPVNIDYCPGYALTGSGVNNPLPPVAGGAQAGGGWWYLGTLEKLFRETIAPMVAQGKIRVMTPSEWAAYLGNPQ